MPEAGLFINRLKLFIWSVSAGIIIVFIFFNSSSNVWSNDFNPFSIVLFTTSFLCGLILGILTLEHDPITTFIATIIMTITVAICVIFILMSPIFFGIAIVIDTFYIFLAQIVMVTVIQAFPMGLLGSMIGRYLAENTLFSSSLKTDHNLLKQETQEWYRMLEKKLEEKKVALERVTAEQNSSLEQEKQLQDLPEQ